MIYYLAHPWTNNPTKSFENAVNWTQQLREKGLFIFSPILHTHPYWECLNDECDERTEQYIAKEDWLAWDLTLMDALMAGDGCDREWNTDHCPKCGKQLQWKHTRHEILKCCDQRYNTFGEWGEGDWFVTDKYDTKLNQQTFYDSHLVVLLSETAIHDDNTTRAKITEIGIEEFARLPMVTNNNGNLIYWKSEGCRQEYEHAKAKHVRVLSLEAFLEGREVEL